MPLLFCAQGLLAGVVARGVGRALRRFADANGRLPAVWGALAGVPFAFVSALTAASAATVQAGDGWALAGAFASLPFAAGFFLGPWAGLSAGLAAAVVRVAAVPVLGAGDVSCAGSAIAAFVAGVTAGFASRVIYPGLRPGLLGASLFAFVAAQFRDMVEFLIGWGDVSQVYEAVFSGTCFEGFAFVAAAIGGGILCGKAFRPWRVRTFSTGVLASLALALALVETTILPIQRIVEESMFYENGYDLIATGMDSFGVSVNRCVINAMGESRGEVPSRAYLEAQLARYHLDELTVVDKCGRILVSTDPAATAARKGLMTTDPADRALMMVTNPAVNALAQDFRAIPGNGDEHRFYVAHACRNGAIHFIGGFSAANYVARCRNLVEDFLDMWKPLEKPGYVLVVNRATGRVEYVTNGHEEALGRTLESIVGHALDYGKLDWPCLGAKGYDDAIGGRPFSAKLFGATASVCLLTVGSYRYALVLPFAEVRAPVRRIAHFAGIALLALFAVFSFVGQKAKATGKRLEELHKVRDRRVQKDLATARAIQMASLPTVFPPFPHCLQIDLAASIRTAREVGGDFYDYYFARRNKLVFLVADVSGKGVPAAMFMMRAKTVLKTCVQEASDLADAVTRANARLCEDNRDSMFVTAWIGMLDVHTGELEYVNAGHNPPYLRRADGSVRAIDPVSGFFLAGMEGTEYRRFSMKLAPGDMLFLFTDGITEANDVRRSMFGEERLEAALSTMCGTAGEAPAARDYCQRVFEDVEKFAGTAPQFDDMTAVALVWHGNPRKESLEVPATRNRIPEVAAFVERALRADGVPESVFADVMVSVDEIVTNVVSYSGSPKLKVTHAFSAPLRTVRFTFVDSGMPWNPLAHADPDVTLGADERAIGGLGILMVKKLMDDLFYEYRDGENRLSFRKRFDAARKG